MDGFLLIIVISALVFVLSGWVVKETFSQPLVSVEGEAGSFKQKFKVRDRNDKQLAANSLARLTYTLERLMNACKNDVNFMKEHGSKYNFMKQNWRPNNIQESDPDSNTTSYSLNKGQTLVFCIRQKDNQGSFVDDNTLAFVGIHELAHLMTMEIGHTPLFWSNMEALLEVAVAHRLYRPENYEASPKKYCGIEITSSPLKDTSFV